MIRRWLRGAGAVLLAALTPTGIVAGAHLPNLIWRAWLARSAEGYAAYYRDGTTSVEQVQPAFTQQAQLAQYSAVWPETPLRDPISDAVVNWFDAPVGFNPFVRMACAAAVFLAAAALVLLLAIARDVRRRAPNYVGDLKEEGRWNGVLQDVVTGALARAAARGVGGAMLAGSAATIIAPFFVLKASTNADVLDIVAGAVYAGTLAWLALDGQRLLRARTVEVLPATRRRCRGCNYQLQGLAAGACPECGRRYAETIALFDSSPQRGWWRRLLWLGAAACALAVLMLQSAWYQRTVRNRQADMQGSQTAARWSEPSCVLRLPVGSCCELRMRSYPFRTTIRVERDPETSDGAHPHRLILLALGVPPKPGAYAAIGAEPDRDESDLLAANDVYVSGGTVGGTGSMTWIGMCPFEAVVDMVGESPGQSVWLTTHWPIEVTAITRYDARKESVAAWRALEHVDRKRLNHRSALEIHDGPALLRDVLESR